MSAEEFTSGYQSHLQGTATPLVGIGACVSIQFVVVEAMKRRFHSMNDSSPLTNGQLYLAGAAGGVANSIVSGPVEHIRTRLQVQASSATYRGPIDCIQKIYRAHGLRGIYKGQAITIAREFQGYGAYFFAYEWLVRQSMARSGQAFRSELPSWQVCLYGAAAGYAMWLTIYPMDVVKSKLQTDGFSGGDRKYTSTLDCVRKTLAAEGVAGFFRGIGPCLLRAAPCNAATFMG